MPELYPVVQLAKKHSLVFLKHESVEVNKSQVHFLFYFALHGFVYVFSFCHEEFA